MEIRDQHALIIDSKILSIMILSIMMIGLLPSQHAPTAPSSVRILAKIGLSPLPAC
jgi:hypothetical protein